MVKINSLEFENVKRIKAVQINPTKNGLTIIGWTIVNNLDTKRRKELRVK